MATSADDERVRASFTRQAPQFARPDAIYASDALAAWVVSFLQPLEPTMEVLEVACGAAHAAEAVAPLVGRVVGVDLTPVLLDAGRLRLAERGVANVELREGDARALPYPAASFDVVFCRLAVHHFPEPALQVAEMARVCRPGGLAALFDITAIDPAHRDTQDDLDRLIDPSHTRRLTADELAALLERHAGPVIERVSRQSTSPLEGYLRGLDANEDAAGAVRAAVATELGGGPATGLGAHTADGEVMVTTEMTAVRARRR